MVESGVVGNEHAARAEGLQQGGVDGFLPGVDGSVGRVTYRPEAGGEAHEALQEVAARNP